MTRQEQLEDMVRSLQRENAELRNKIAELKVLNARLEKQNTDYGWIINPDRMGK